MAVNLQPPLLARNGHTLKVLGIARISTIHQDALSLEDQEQLYRKWLNQNTDLPYDLTMISGRGSGEDLERIDYLEALYAIKTRTYDLIVAEDLGRITRRVHSQIFCELCEDAGTRLIAINDNVDTSIGNWRLNAAFASMRHEMYNADTAKRIRRSLRNRFEHGGVLGVQVFGIIKPLGANKDSELSKNPKAQPIYDEMFRLLENGASYSEVADWLNDTKVELPPYARSKKWRCSLVTQLIHNPILKGLRVRNRKISKRINETGRHKSVAAPPEELLERYCPHIAFIEPARYDLLIKKLDEKNAKYRRKGTGGIDPRKNVSKKRTIWPGQHIDCGVCGRLLVYGAHGQKNSLACSGALKYQCWNGTSINSEKAGKKIIIAIEKELSSLKDFDKVLLKEIEKELKNSKSTVSQRQGKLQTQQDANTKQMKNIIAAIGDSGHSASLLAELKTLEATKAQLANELSSILTTSTSIPKMPSMEEIKTMVLGSIRSLAINSQEFGRLLRKLIDRIVVLPFQHCDGSSPVLRAYFELNLASLLPNIPSMESLSAALRKTMVVDLFDPPQREAFRTEATALIASGMNQREAAKILGITSTAVQRAQALDKKMKELGITDPYIQLNEPPPENSKIKRHKHPRYKFNPVERPDPPKSES
jgi:DNA invertase Pin-like site-specific DNA recombinase